jgi:hypothetical protein
LAATGAATEAGEESGGTVEEAPARTVGEVAMMPGEIASRWPVQRSLTLAILQDRRAKLIPEPSIYAQESMPGIYANAKRNSRGG